MAAKMLSLVALLLAYPCSAALRGPSFADEADDVRKMMEGVREKTEGDAAASPAAQAAKSTALASQKLEAGEFFPGEHKLDDQLMKKADQAAALMKEVEKEGDPTKKSTKTSLAKVATESKAQRAARYFALHGMKKIGHVLGE